MMEQWNIGFKRNKSNLEMILFGLLSPTFHHSIFMAQETVTLPPTLQKTSSSDQLFGTYHKTGNRSKRKFAFFNQLHIPPKGHTEEFYDFMDAA